MTKAQLNRQLNLLLVDLAKVDKRMQRISKKLDIPENNDIKNLLAQVESLIEIGEQHARRTEN